MWRAYIIKIGILFILQVGRIFKANHILGTVKGFKKVTSNESSEVKTCSTKFFYLFTFETLYFISKTEYNLFKRPLLFNFTMCIISIAKLLCKCTHIYIAKTHMLMLI